ncbi:alpha/beta hydrolase family protein [Sinimarinibacterium thermocellulolyticum]|uniref:Peptidase S9 prolyl oligopeptidase catalytic domain-containing protein n=1 Tax=Sinimarinibacterium thermocellulolyticum TaxID=3170016 RepID=A0ABV2AAC3_9GAMM
MAVVHLPPPRPREWLALLPIVAGLYWLLADSGGTWLLLALAPGLLLLGGGLGLLLFPGDARTLGPIAIGSALGAVLSPLACWAAGLGDAFWLLLLSAASFVIAGRLSWLRTASYEGVPEVERSTSMDLKLALDELVLGYFVTAASIPGGALATRICEDAARLEKAITENGWDDDPAALHLPPPPPDDTQVERARLWGIDYEILRFESGFRTPPSLPGDDRWLQHDANRHCHVRLLRHAGAPRPWLLCIHGYRMGRAWMDFSLFSPNWLHHRLGLNLIQPVLPLHGPRSVGTKSGDHFLDGDLTDLLHAEMQTLWDLRRTLAWLRQHEPGARVGVLGFSLGGYNAALLATYEADLDFVIAGIPVIDLAAALWRVLPPAHLRYFAAHGLDEHRYRRLLAPVSPLARPPLQPIERRHIFAATGDRLVPPEHPLALSAHWQVPVTWYQGSHLSVRRERTMRQAVRAALDGAGWTLR